jgi:hypothetical protein
VRQCRDAALEALKPKLQASVCGNADTLPFETVKASEGGNADTLDSRQ